MIYADSPNLLVIHNRNMTTISMDNQVHTVY